MASLQKLQKANWSRELEPGKKSNPLLCDDKELKDKDYDEGMSVFVRAEQSGRLAKVKEEIVAKHKRNLVPFMTCFRVKVLHSA